MKRKRRREEEEDGPTNETTNRTSSLLCQKTFLSFSHSTYERIPSHEETMMIYPYNSAPSVRKDVFGERKQEIYIFSFPSFQFYFADLTIFIRVNGIYVYIYIYIFGGDKRMVILVEDLRFKVLASELWYFA